MKGEDVSKFLTRNLSEIMSSDEIGFKYNTRNMLYNMFDTLNKNL